jgi:hypothetical protein
LDEHAISRSYRKILFRDAAQPAEAGKIALGDKIQMFHQGLHRRVIAVSILELDREAFG